MRPTRRYIASDLYSPASPFLGKLVPSQARCDLRFNVVSTAELTVSSQHPALTHTLVDGTRARVWLVEEDHEAATITRTRLLEGAVGEPRGTGPFGAVTVPVEDDLAMVRDLLAWSDPDQPLAAQTGEPARYEGPAETRALAMLADNAARLDLPWDVAPSEGRGPEDVTEIGLVPIADQVLSMLTAARLQLVVERDPDTGRWDLAVREGEVFPTPLTPHSGILTSWTWLKRRPTATRAIVLGPGTGVAQERALVIDEDLEAQLGRVMEVSVDARQAEPGTDLTVRGWAALAARRGGMSVQVGLRDAGWFRFPAYRIGTKLPLAVGPVAVDDVISEIEITQDSRGQLKITPRVGFGTADPTQQLVETTAGLAAGIRELRTI